MPKVSICIPAYNQASYLRQAIDSILCQTYHDYEIIITDDSSTDVVKDLIDEYRLPGVMKYFRNIAPLGAPENWNEGMRKASGDYIKILHHDDWLSSGESLAKYVALLENNPESDFAFSATKAIDPGVEQWAHFISHSDVAVLKNNPLILYRNNMIGSPSTVIFRRSAGLLFDKKLKWLVDVDQYIRMIDANNRIQYSPELLVVTGVAKGRVTDGCRDNKAVEVYEHLYLLNEFCRRRQLYGPGELKSCFLKAIAICDKHVISRRREVIRCGYERRLPIEIQTYLLLKASFPLLARAYKKILRDKQSRAVAY